MKPDQDIQIRSLRFKNVHGFLVREKNRALLVDTGYTDTSDLVLNELAVMGLQPEHLKLILLTHTHFDHAGGAAILKEKTGAPVMVHALEKGYLENGRTPIPPGTRWKGKLISWTGRHFYRKIEKYRPVEAAYTAGNETSLEPFGFSGKVIHTPGHTPGSLSLVMENGVAMVGDCMMGISLKEHFPPFAVRKSDVLESWKKLLDSGAEIFYPAHGHRIRRSEIETELPHAVRKYG